MDKLKVLITGGGGYIGSTLHKELKSYDVTSITRRDFDLSNKNEVAKWFEDKTFDVVLHTAVAGGSRLKKDDGEVCYKNLQMFYNLYYNRTKFKKLIHFGSGAELGTPTDPYGLSKRAISNVVEHEPNFFNIRIFGVFDENELETRFIKSNILRYIHKEEIIIHQNKVMDFFYMKDLISLVNHYIQTPSSNLLKEVECSYLKKYTLFDIATIINNLSNYKVKIKINNQTDSNFYAGQKLPDINCIGLEEGIRHVYRHFLKEYIIGSY